MSAGDIPEAGYRGGLAMARVLVTYMDDPAAIRRAIRGEFDIAPTPGTIRELRLQYLAGCRRDEPIRHKVEGGYYPAQVSRALDETNRRFLQRLAAAYPERFAA